MRKNDDFIKYQTKNPIKKFLVNRFLDTIGDEIENYKIKSIIDLGCGTGFVEEYLLKRELGIEMVGVDKDRNAIQRAKIRNPKLKFIKTDILKIKPKRKFDLVLILEVLEHLERPQKAILVAKRLGKRVIISVPWEPWFSLLSFLSGRHLKRLGKHPGHLNFFSRKTIKDLLTKNFSYCEIKSSFPWLIAICEDRK